TDVYKGFDLIEDKNFERPDADELIAALKAKNLGLAKKNMINVLENFTLRAYPSVTNTKDKMIADTSPSIAVMSGSGPTIIGFYKNRRSAEAACAKMLAINPETFLTKTMV
ncbi:MAG: hypothetical protein FWG53_00605, partial [Clostridiales bacterium]|nr:hypothetical protein [Clostridiales bacterium]